MEKKKVDGKTVIVDDTGRITLPIKFRDKKGIKTGDKVTIKMVGDIITVMPINERKKTLSFEYIYNKMQQQERRILELNDKLETIRELVIREIVGD